MTASAAVQLAHLPHLRVRGKHVALAIASFKGHSFDVVDNDAPSSPDIWEPPPCSATDVPSEAGAAARFARLHGDQVRFDHRRQHWLIFDEHRWTHDADGAVVRLALQFAKVWQKEAITLERLDEREAAVKFALRLERRDALMNVLALARVLKPIADAGDQWDADPWLLGVPNGVIDLSSGLLLPGHPDRRVTMQTTAAYDPAAPCPRWEQFIADIFGPDVALMTFVQRALGYSLTGITSEQALFLLYGTGANGKGTLTNTLKKVLGSYGLNLPFATIELKDRAAIPNDLAALVNRRFVIASETNDGTRLNEGRIKALTGCDPITARFLHGEFFTFEPFAKFWLSVNHKPIVRDDSHGFWRRLRLIPFTRRFDVNPTLADELQAEATGILAWCVRGCLDWQHHGLQAPPVVTAGTKKYEEDSDVLARFLTEACDLEPAALVGARELFEHYETWANAQRLGPRERLTSTMFGRKMAERFERLDGNHRTYRGVARRQAL